MKTSSIDGTDCGLHLGVSQGHEGRRVTTCIGLMPELSARFAGTFSHVSKKVLAMTKHFS